ncbi:hypothetical protein C0Q70_07018 [Pomacea canaliculata]|uniref:Uncharacterized protein n=1 Tax=Pomacea canaliculata TaxID=400727 RepID=A0A2T7PDV6_POMCA|nr:THO complex subunit 6 homolog isoform X2 [Pomacea canaliculata]PVD31603.1 hypothetical protein C0Q70_07018 [Pomacea canaliculata]
MPENKGKTGRQFPYTIVYDQCFSPCGKYLAAGSNYGDIAIFNMSAALSSDATEKSKHPVFIFKGCKDGGIFCLTSTETFLLSAGDGEIQAWRWSDLTAKTAKLAWSLTLPRSGVLANAEVNSMIINQQSHKSCLYAGGGDKKIHTWDLETGQYLSALEGHTDYIHKLLLMNEGQDCLSASEDGTVRIWDTRTTGESVQCIEPFKNELCARPLMGKWLRCLAVDSEEGWLICGGGPKMSAWHLRTLSPTTVFDTPSVSQNVALFHEDYILSAGSLACMNHWMLTGQLKSSIPCSPTSVFSLNINKRSDASKVLCIAGASPYIDVCINFGYTSFALVFQAA